MKLELNSEAQNVFITAIVALVVVALMFTVYRYNALAYEQGYTQQQLEHSTQSIWVKAPPEDQALPTPKQ